MSNTQASRSNLEQPTVYQIRLKGHLDPRWTAWFGNLTIVLEESGDTLLTGSMVDQAALYGLLKKVRDLGLPLLSVNCLPQPTTSNQRKKTDDE